MGLYGYIFPGNINLMILELYTSKRHRFLIVMLALVVVFESIYCLGSLLFINTLKNNTRLFLGIESVSYILLFILGLWMLLERKGNNKQPHKNTIVRGILAVIIHPQQIPYWLIAGSILSESLNLIPTNRAILTFIFFNAIGTLLIMLTYMFLGKRILNYFKMNIFLLNKVMGIVYILLFFTHMFII